MEKRVTWHKRRSPSPYKQRPVATNPHSPASPVAVRSIVERMAFD
jgi:hypothetical protein